MRQTSLAAVAALGATANAASLSDVCTVSNVQAALPANGTLLGIDLIPSTVTASALYNATASMGSTTTYTYCNVTIAYTHTGKGDRVVLKYAFPSPSDFENRFYVGGGGGYSQAMRLEASHMVPLGAPPTQAMMPLTTAMMTWSYMETGPSTGTLRTCLDIRHLARWL
jgi:hypothetical protein